MDILEADRIKDKITYYTSSATRIYQLSSHDSEDFHHELVLSLQRKLKTYSLNQEHDDFHLENSLLNYMNLFFIGESERIAKTICGLMTKDDKGFSSIKGRKSSYDEFERPDDLRYQSDEKMRQLNNLGIIRKILFRYFTSNDNLILFKAFSLHYCDGLSWNEIARRFKINSTVKTKLQREIERKLSIFRHFAYTETDLDVEYCHAWNFHN